MTENQNPVEAGAIAEADAAQLAAMAGQASDEQLGGDGQPRDP